MEVFVRGFRPLVLWTTVGCGAHAKYAESFVPLPPTTPTSAGYAAMLEGRVGADSDHLARVWGAPRRDDVFTMSGGNSLWTYERDTSYSYKRAEYSTTTYNEYTDSLNTTTIGGDTVNVEMSCRTEFEVDVSNRVVGWRAVGNACRLTPDPGPKDCTGRITSGRVREYRLEDGLVTAVLNHSYEVVYRKGYRQVLRTLDLVSFSVDERHLQHFTPESGSRQWVAVCHQSDLGPYVILNPEGKTASVADFSHLDTSEPHGPRNRLPVLSLP
jgi:hypothetical protein